jgi:hypothetical protein
MASNVEKTTDAANADMADTRENVGLGRDGHIRMDVKRSRRFTDALCDLEYAIETLAGADACAACSICCSSVSTRLPHAMTVSIYSCMTICCTG